MCGMLLGNIAQQKPSHRNTGTVISVADLFKKLPVRRQIYNKPKKLRDELSRIEELLMSYAIVHPQLRITLRNDNNMIWRKNRTSDHQHSINGKLSGWGSQNTRKTWKK